MSEQCQRDSFHSLPTRFQMIVTAQQKRAVWPRINYVLARREITEVYV
ncbi:MAG: hypothetical protein SNJ83_01850 [Aggregatilineales bacterium]